MLIVGPVRRAGANGNLRIVDLRQPVATVVNVAGQIAVGVGLGLLQAVIRIGIVCIGLLQGRRKAIARRNIQGANDIGQLACDIVGVFRDAVGAVAAGRGQGARVRRQRSENHGVHAHRRAHRVVHGVVADLGDADDGFGLSYARQPRGRQSQNSGDRAQKAFRVHRPAPAHGNTSSLLINRPTMS